MHDTMPIEKFSIDNYNEDEEDLLEYVINVANEFAPDIVLDETGTLVESKAPLIFKRRYNNGNLNVYFTYKDYVKTDGLKETDKRTSTGELLVVI